jgi:Flp pilus assembly protein TadB
VKNEEDYRYEYRIKRKINEKREWSKINDEYEQKMKTGWKRTKYCTITCLVSLFGALIAFLLSLPLFSIIFAITGLVSGSLGIFFCFRVLWIIHSWEGWEKVEGKESKRQ